jgi:rhodanese-related sulfurtransferase
MLIRQAGQEPNFTELLRAEYLDTGKGSTLSALQKAAEDAGLHTEILVKATTRMLRRCPYRAVLHVRGSDASKSQDHYVLYLGARQDRAKICDPPGPPHFVAFGELASRWGGNALVVSPEPLNLRPMLAREKARIVMMGMAGIVAIGIVRLAKRATSRVARLHAFRYRLALSVVEVMALVVGTLLVAVFHHLAAEGGLLANPLGVLAIQSAHAADFVPKIRPAQARAIMDAGGVFVDARFSRDFAAGHIAGALSVPVHAGDEERKQVMNNVRDDAKIVVYCQSAGCQFAETVAVKLREDGFSNLFILQGGWNRWSVGNPQGRKADS